VKFNDAKNLYAFIKIFDFFVVFLYYFFGVLGPWFVKVSFMDMFELSCLMSLLIGVMQAYVHE